MCRGIKGLQMNTPTTTIKSKNFAQSLLDNAVAISAQIHGSSDYTAVLHARRSAQSPGFPESGVCALTLLRSSPNKRLRILAEDEVDDVYSFDWLDAVAKYADAILKLEKNELDRLNLERLAHRIVWGDYGNQCPGLCRACQPIA